MLIAVAAEPLTGPPPVPRRMKFNRNMCGRMLELGLLEPGRYELVEGELITLMGMNRRPALAVTATSLELGRVFGATHVQAQMPVDLAHEDNLLNEPQPDVFVLLRHFREIASGNPSAADLRLVVEVADSSLSFDRYIKGRLYARAGISEYWVLDLTSRRLMVHRDPTGDVYATVSAYAPEEFVSPLAAPDARIPVANLLP